MTETEIKSVLAQSEIAGAQPLKNQARQTEFLRARWLLRAGLSIKQPVLKAESGAPYVDEKTAVSITHSQGHVAVATCAKLKYAGLGIDLELVERIRAELKGKICTPAEELILHGLTPADQKIFIALTFCIKEAIFKAHFPIGNKFFYFHAAEIRMFDLTKMTAHGVFTEDVSPLHPKGSAFAAAWRYLECDGQAFVLAWSNAVGLV